MSEWKTAGKVRMIPKGTYSASSTYEVLDIVSNVETSISYIAKKAVPAGTALTNTEYWMPVVDVTEALNNAASYLQYIAGGYSTSSTYSVGDYCIHNGGLYRCTTVITSGESWNASHWTETSFLDEVQDYKDGIDDVVAVQDTEPTSPDNKIWIKQTTTNGVQVPTYEEFTKAKSMVADPFSVTKNYVVGNYVEYNDELYIFKVDHAAGAWASSDVDKVALGNDVADLKSAFETIANPVTDPAFWTQGAINIMTGADAVSISRIRTGYIPTNITELRVAAGYGIVLFCYNSSDVFEGTWNGTTAVKVDPPTTFTGNIVLNDLRTYKIRVHAKKLANTNVTPADDYTGVAFVRYTDNTLTKAAIPADAKATGDAIQAVEENLLNISQPFVKLTKGSSIFTVEEGYYATTGNKTALAGYVLCSYTADIDFEIYADETTLAGTIALFVSIYNNSIASGNNVACYKRSTQENTLPTEANKATVHAGQILAISIYTPSTNPADFGIYADYKKVYSIKPVIDFPTKYTNFPYSKKIAWFGDSISELKQLPHIAGMLLNATVYDCSIRGSTIGRTYSNFDEFSFYKLVTSIIAEDFTAQFAQLDAYEQAQGKTYPGIRENLTTLSTLDFDDVDYVVLLQGTNDFGITAVHATTGYDTKVAEMQARMDDAISRFITAYPKLKFYIISPPFRATPTEDYYGDTLADYIAAEQEVAEKYAMPFYNLLTHSRICDENKTTYMNSDNGVYVHPNDYGDAWLAELAAKFISVN